MITNKEDFFKAAAYKSKEVPLPDREGTLMLRELSGADRDKVLQVQQSGEKAMVVLATAVALSAEFLDESDVPALLNSCSEKVISALSSEVLELSKMGSQALEEAQKNSESDQS